MKEMINLPASQQVCENTKGEGTTERVKENESITYSELLTSDHDCPISSVLSSPLSKEVTDVSASYMSTTSTTVHPAGQQFIPCIQYSYSQEAIAPNQGAVTLSDALNFASQELSTQNARNPSVQRNTLHFPTSQLFDMKEAMSIHSREDETDRPKDGTKVRISLPIRELMKGGENSRKRQRTSSDGVKTTFQKKMEHLDKEKERRLRQTKCYDYLRNLVPCGSQKTDKANILEATVAYLAYIKETLGTSMDVIDKNFLDEFEKSRAPFS